MHNGNSGVHGRSVIMISCARETNGSSNYVVVYALLGKFKTYRLKVVLKRTPISFCICADTI